MAAVALLAANDTEAVSAQLAALERCALPSEIEVVIVAAAVEPGVEHELRRASGASIVRSARPAGRRNAWQLAAESARAPYVVALSTLAMPRPGFLEPMIDELRKGAALVAPVVAGSYGLLVGPDGGLYPRGPVASEPVAAIPLDCVAAPAELFAAGVPDLPALEGHAELQLARWASRHGGIAVASEACVERLPATDATAVVCTHNRPDELRECVASLRAAGVAEILIVDSASTDDTPLLAAALAAPSGGTIRVVTEKRSGLSHARNAGASAASHELLLFIDDDARPAPGWLEHLTWALTRPGIVHAGGPLCALWPPSRPAGWPGSELQGLLSILDLGDHDHDIVAPEFVYGANWAVRRSALQAVGGFEPGLGFDSSRTTVMIGGEETAVAERLEAAQLGRAHYVVAGAVGHRIAADRLDPSWLRARSLAAGVEGVYRWVLRGERSKGHLVAWAANAASRLVGPLAHAHVPLVGCYDIHTLLGLIEEAPLPLEGQVALAGALGELAAATSFVGEREVIIDELHLDVSGTVNA